ncbi:LOW QUALITY PROTEIN: phosphotriesterase-related protein [Nilaparvata lugens]|uniref:LOW QUALITY PROTEIN: phosphotriesterase-related protein n=1 Tax=Nilaparvata lugens TaxID=108931 RepID=UPI00193EB5A6|nr:LOW QUALITY PROTEIN: phosphotriesterase-related protein [Nilaparvata lugens]
MSSNSNVNTVLGKVSVHKLGRTLTHEHVTLSFDKFFSPPPRHLESYLSGGISLENVGIVRQYPYSCKYNLEFRGPEVDEAVIEDLRFFKKCGGGTIIENTTYGLNRNIPLMLKASKETGVNIILGTGYYVSGVQGRSALSKSSEEMYNYMKAELLDGCLGFPDVKCGMIAEQASSWPIDDFEKRAIESAAQVQSEVNCAVSFHPGRDQQAPFEILRIFQEAGGKASRTVMSHLDRTLLTEESLLEYAAQGGYCQFDLFGTECSLYQLNPSVDMRSDAQRIDQIITNFIMQGNDSILGNFSIIWFIHFQMKFGGHGFSHLLTSVVPKMLVKGISQRQIDKILMDNPASMLCG